MKMDAMIIGGGASGLAAAVSLARRGAKVCVLEKQDRVGRKLLSTGNGRCNLTNMDADLGHYHGCVAAARAALEAFPPEKVLRFFEEIGVPARIDGEGRAYPMSNQAASVLDALRLSAAELGAELRTGFAVTSVERAGGAFVATSAAGETARGNRVLVCTGGLAAPKLGACGDGYALLSAMGHKISPRYPALSPLKTAPEAVRGLKGQRLECNVSLMIGEKAVRREQGEILFGDGSVSGIAAMQLAGEISRQISHGVKPRLRMEILENGADFLRRRLERLPDRAAEDFLTGVVPKRVGQALMRVAGVENQTIPSKMLRKSTIFRLAALMEAWEIPVTGVCGFDQAQSTMGGANPAEFFPDTLESRLHPGLFAAGEVLDVCGDCGGYNLQWAWASGLTAAEAMA